MYVPIQDPVHINYVVKLSIWHEQISFSWLLRPRYATRIWDIFIEILNVQIIIEKSNVGRCPV